MYIKVLIAVFLSLLLSGCATARKKQDTQIQQPTNRIEYLEAELQRKDQEISALESELESTQAIILTLRRQKDTGVLRLSVRQIQTALKKAGFYNGSIDGIMGLQTRRATKEFQKANGLKPDGIVGKRTLKKLHNYLD